VITNEHKFKKKQSSLYFSTYTPIQKLGVSNLFLKSLLCAVGLHFKNNNFVNIFKKKQII